MIFDNFENEEDFFKAYPSQNTTHLPEIDISLDNLILQRKERENCKDFSSYYQTYQMLINGPFSFITPLSIAPLSNKENISSNLRQSPKKDSQKYWQMMNFAKENNPKSILDQNNSIIPSLILDLNSHPSQSCAKKTILRPIWDSLENTPKKITCQFKKKNDDFSPEKENFKSPNFEGKSFVKLAKRDHIETIPENDYQQKVFNAKKRQNQEIGLKMPGLKYCKKLLFHEHRFSIEDFSNYKEVQYKNLKSSKRTFSTNSIACEIFKTNFGTQNRSFESILSTDSIDSAKEETKDTFLSNCNSCKKEYKFRDVIAEIYVCRHSMHKECLDEILFQNFKEGTTLLCPICQLRI